MNIADLDSVNDLTIRLAGPRYTPGVDPGAPNIEIRNLVEAFDALAHGPGAERRLSELTVGLEAAANSGRYTLDSVFKNHRVTPSTVVADLRGLVAAAGPDNVPAPLKRSRRDLRTVNRVLERAQGRLYERLSTIRGDESQRDTRERIDDDLRNIAQLSNAVGEAMAYLDGAPGRLLGDLPRLLLLGDWGTGKTHFLCDAARRAMREDTPAVVILASTLTSGVDPLDAAAQRSGLAADGQHLLRGLNALGRQTQRRALLMIDAINEGEREDWRQRLSGLARRVGRHRHVGLVLSCRRPFDHAIFQSDQERKLFVRLDHPGFAEQEFDAQLEFFTHYGIATPHVPLLTPEFSRPLFLKLLCESLKTLSASGKHRQLRDIASGQKGMTFVLERFVKTIGAPIEQDFGFGSEQCWRILKGAAGQSGLAGTMASLGRDFLTRPEALVCIATMMTLPPENADHLLKRMLTDGLLAEEMRYHSGNLIEAVVFPYQRFGDHLIARHLLDAHLSPADATEQSIRRLFYASRPLGQPFELKGGGSRFKAPGLAAALMLEFPERMKRTSLPKELIHYLPRPRQYVAPMKDVFLEGLYWRGAGSFSAETDHLVSFLLQLDDKWIRDETLEVLATLATRSSHPYNADRLYGYLKAQSMPDRDLIWSEYLRRRGQESVVYRLLAWVERTAADRRLSNEVTNELRFLSLILTTTERVLRDRATRAITYLGLQRPAELFAESLNSLDFNDPYVSERMLAAAYGVAMRQWAAPDGEGLRRSIVGFARQLVRLMFLPGAPYATTHTLTRDYALGIIELARRCDRNAIGTQHVHHLSAPHWATGPGFPPANEIGEGVVEAVKDVLHMDFENYTIGRLVPERANYQMEHPEYQQVRRQILWRVSNLGYRTDRFGQIDQAINRYAWNRQDGGGTDRYGKKYSWIAFFEMYGQRADQGLLDANRINERSSDCDVDPSFPEAARAWDPQLPDIFGKRQWSLAEWLRSGPEPKYEELLELDEVDGIRGRWVLLDGFVLQRAGELEVFTFIRGVFVRSTAISTFHQHVKISRYLGNDMIPEGGSDHYTYAGEIPWSVRFGTQEDSQGRSTRRRFARAFYWHGGRWNGFRVEIPVWHWTWESYHSSLNQIGSMSVPSPHLCERLSLRGHRASFDLFDDAGRQASLYRNWPQDSSDISRSHVVYLRRDLLLRYLDETGQELVWVPWGERRVYRPNHDNDRSSEVMAGLQAYDNTFGTVLTWASNSCRRDIEDEHAT